MDFAALANLHAFIVSGSTVNLDDVDLKLFPTLSRYEDAMRTNAQIMCAHNPQQKTASTVTVSVRKLGKHATMGVRAVKCAQHNGPKTHAN